MELNKKIPFTKKRILTILTIILGLGISFGAIYFMYYRKLNDENALSTGLININFSETSSMINLNSNAPVVDDVGLSRTPYDFTITNTSQIPIDVNIKIDVQNNTTFQTSEYSAIRYGLYINDELVIKDYVHEDLNLYTYENLAKNGTISCKLYMWVDYYYDTPGKTFKAGIKAEGQSRDVVVLPEATMSLSSNSGTIDCEGSTTLTVTTNSDGIISCSPTDGTISTCSVDQNTKVVTITGKSGQEGSQTVTISQAAGTNYAAATDKTYNLTINPCGSWHYIRDYPSASRCAGSYDCPLNCRYAFSASGWSCAASESVAPSAPSLESGGYCWCKY